MIMSSLPTLKIRLLRLYGGGVGKTPKICNANFVLLPLHLETKQPFKQQYYYGFFDK